jgi:hypothetical protein
VCKARTGLHVHRCHDDGLALLITDLMLCLRVA